MRDTAQRVRDEIQARRSTWQVWHVRAEAHRQVRAANLPAEHVDAVVDLVTDHTLTAASVRLTPSGDGIDEPAELRRADGSSVYEVAGSAVYTSTAILAAEQRLVARRRPAATGHRASPTRSTWRCSSRPPTGPPSTPGRPPWSPQMATSGARLQLAIAPAGAGKTTAMRALAAAWAEDGGTVLGLAPSAAAAAVLREQTGATTDTLAKLTWSISHDDLPDWARTIGPRTLVVIDEAGMADTLSLAAAVDFVTARGGQVRLVGDNQQLAAIGAGGVLRDIAATHGALHLSELMRFTDPAEGAASLALRDGRTEALGFYLDHDRVHVGDLATITDDVFTAWATDRAAGLDAIMLAPTRDLVAELNQRAQTHRLAGRDPGPGVRLADGNTAYVGRHRSSPAPTTAGCASARTTGSRTATAGPSTHVHHDGSLAVRAPPHRPTVTLPADYVAASAELGYATTVHGAQGISVDTIHGLATGEETRQQLYTMLTRGAAANHLYLQVVGDGDPHDVIRTRERPPADRHRHPRGHPGPRRRPRLRHHHRRASRPPPPRGSVAAAARYLDALHVAAEHHLGPTAIAAPREPAPTGSSRASATTRPGRPCAPTWSCSPPPAPNPLTALQLPQPAPRAGHRRRPRRRPRLAPGRHPARRRLRTTPLAARHPAAPRATTRTGART